MCYKITKQSMSIQVVNIGTEVILYNRIPLSHTHTHTRCTYTHIHTDSGSPTLKLRCFFRPKTSHQHLK